MLGEPFARAVSGSPIDEFLAILPYGLLAIVLGLQLQIVLADSSFDATIVLVIAPLARRIAIKGIVPETTNTRAQRRSRQMSEAHGTW